jgi:hypothetical protein
MPRESKTPDGIFRNYSGAGISMASIEKRAGFKCHDQDYARDYR